MVVAEAVVLVSVVVMKGIVVIKLEKVDIVLDVVDPVPDEVATIVGVLQRLVSIGIFVYGINGKVMDPPIFTSTCIVTQEMGKSLKGLQ